MAFASTAGVVLCMIGSSLLLICSGLSHSRIRKASRGDRDDRQPRDVALTGAALLLGVAPVLLSAVGATVRTLVGWGATYADFLWSIVARSAQGEPVTISPSKDPNVLVLQPANIPALNGHYTIDLIGVTAIGAMCMFIVVFLLVTVISPHGPRGYTEMPVRPDSRLRCGPGL